MFGALMALLSMTSCYNGNSKSNESTTRKDLDEIVKFF